jgi:hypothetical protein
MFKVTPKSARRADSFFIHLSDGRRTRLFGSTTYTINAATFKANERAIRAAGCTVVDVSTPVEAPVVAEPVAVAAPAVAEPVVVVDVPAVAEPEVSAPVEEPTPEDVVVDSTSDDSTSSDAVPEEERVTRRRRSKSVE